MPSTFQLNTAADYWLEIVVPDCNEYFANQESLRHALHAAISLFHMSDWVFHTHEAAVRANFTFKDRNGSSAPVSKSENFANALEQQCSYFGLIRGIANAAKHLKLTDVRPVPSAPRRVSDIGVHPPAFSPKAFSSKVFSTRRRVMLAGVDGSDIEFDSILRDVYEMWTSLRSTHGW